MQIEIDDTGRSRSVSGRLREVERFPVEVEIGVTTRTPFDVHYEPVDTTSTLDGAFSLTTSRWPPTSAGELLATTWVVRATAANGEIDEVAVPMTAGPLTVESVDDDRLDQPKRPFDWRLPAASVAAIAIAVVGLVTGFGLDGRWTNVARTLCGFAVFFAAVPLVGAIRGARQRSVLGDVRCRVDTSPDRLLVRVAVDPDDPAPDAVVSATLLVTEIAYRANVERSPTEREHVIVEHTVELTPNEPTRWEGTIPLSVVAGAPPSQYGRRDDITAAVSWIVRIVVEAPRTPRFVRIMPLVALPTGLDPHLRPRYVEIPKSAR